ncbi:hypothetical protein HDV00_005938 [Rhizophlyctis rosea]|nr:hypothetical protein HDV00_005938 [Rhizophlyctis rosea]
MDIPELLVLTFAQSSVPTLLTCERACKQWSAIIRTTFVEQIWKPKLIAAYPEGCAPVLRGNENWRDVALVSYAWGRPWQPRRVERRVEELDFGEALERKGHSVVRDVTNCFEPHDGGSGSEIVACFESGETIHTWPLSWWRHALRTDTIFTDSHIHPDIDLKPNKSIDSSVRQLGERRAATICGNYIAQFAFEDGLLIESLCDPTYQLKLNSATSMCFNEYVLAYGTFSDTHIHFIRLKDQKQLGECIFPTSSVMAPGRHLRMSRFNLFISHIDLSMERGMVVNAPSLTGTRLYTLQLPFMFSPYHCPWDREIIGRDCSDIHTVLDPMEGTCAKVIGKDGADGESLEEYNKRKGYGFTMMEYPVDDFGKRTGARGVLKCYWRWLSKARPKRGIKK